ncbi:MAG TPA: hypothetical protein VF773_10395 [Verrucomicrobiae bacterium]
MKTKPILLFILIAAQAAALWIPPVQAATDPNDEFAVKVVATVSGTSPWAVTLSWPQDSIATEYRIRRKTISAASWTDLATFNTQSNPTAANATGFTDSVSLSSGVVYEYEVKSPFRTAVSRTRATVTPPHRYPRQQSNLVAKLF